MTVFIRQVVGVFLFICFLVYVFYTGHIPGQTLWSQVSAVSLTDLKQGVVAQNLTEVDFNMLKNEIDSFSLLVRGWLSLSVASDSWIWVRG